MKQSNFSIKPSPSRAKTKARASLSLALLPNHSPQKLDRVESRPPSSQLGWSMELCPSSQRLKKKRRTSHLQARFHRGSSDRLGVVAAGLPPPTPSESSPPSRPFAPPAPSAALRPSSAYSDVCLIDAARSLASAAPFPPVLPASAVVVTVVGEGASLVARRPRVATLLETSLPRRVMLPLIFSSAYSRKISPRMWPSTKLGIQSLRMAPMVEEGRGREEGGEGRERRRCSSLLLCFAFSFSLLSAPKNENALDALPVLLSLALSVQKEKQEQERR